MHSYLFYCSRHPPHLHSFPTRRSSDLFYGGERAYRVVSGQTLASSDPTRPPPANPAAAPAKPGPRLERRPRCRPRSEEHTSELQSRGHLVCRLLLEKTKQPI